VSPDFTAMLVGVILLAACMLAYVWWRFGLADTVTFIVVSGGFTAIMDFLSSFVVRNYEYPGQSRLWVFSFIFFGWIWMCGSCLFLAEGILAGRGRDMFSQPRLGWQVPLLTGVIAVVLDLFIDPVAVAAGQWAWFVEGTVYYGIPLLNFTGWFALMFLAPLVWIWIAQNRDWHFGKKLGLSVVSIIPLSVASVVLSSLLNGAFAALGLR